VAQAYVEGVSTRRVDDLARALGIEGMSKSQVSGLAASLDVSVRAFRERPLDGAPYRHLWLDALAVRVRESGRRSFVRRSSTAMSPLDDSMNRRFSSIHGPAYSSPSVVTRSHGVAPDPVETHTSLSFDSPPSARNVAAMRFASSDHS